MLTHQTLIERASYDAVVAPQDVGTANVTGSWIPVDQFQRFLVVAVSDEVTEGDTLTVQLRQATNDEGSGAADLGDLVTVTAGGAEALTALAEAKASDIDDGFTHITAIVGGSADGTEGAAVIVRADGRFRP